MNEEQPYWRQLEDMLVRLERDPYRQLDLSEARQLHYLYERASADLARLASITAGGDIRNFLEALVAKAYGEIHETRGRGERFKLRPWFLQQFPQTFRRHVRAFQLASLIMLGGSIFGGFVIAIDPAEAKPALLPFQHLQSDPSDRVAREEETGAADQLAGRKSWFSAQLMTHNTKVSILALATGMTFGVGTIMLLFYNGVILGAVASDYLLAGEGTFLLGWLLPHGSVEIPAILIAGQAGLVLASALIGWGTRDGLRTRLRAVRPDLVTLIAGLALLLAWAGIVEAFFSQYHAPILPYSVKIIFGTIQLTGLWLFLSRCGRNEAETVAHADITQEGLL